MRQYHMPSLHNQLRRGRSCRPSFFSASGHLCVFQPTVRLTYRHVWSSRETHQLFKVFMKVSTFYGKGKTWISAGLCANVPALTFFKKVDKAIKEGGCLFVCAAAQWNGHFH